MLYKVTNFSLYMLIKSEERDIRQDTDGSEQTKMGIMSFSQESVGCYRKDMFSTGW